MVKHRDWLMEQLDNKLGLSRMSDMYQTLSCEELIEVDPLECCGIKSACKIKRTKNKIPKVLEISTGPYIKSVTSLDGSIEFHQTTSQSYQRKMRKSTSKYDKTIYYWYDNGHLYFPNIEWDAVRIEGIFLDSVQKRNCVNNNSSYCMNKQDELFPIAPKLVGRMDSEVLRELSATIQLPEQHFIDKNDNTK
jgi:hypothetical protein